MLPESQVTYLKNAQLIDLQLERQKAMQRNWIRLAPADEQWLQLLQHPDLY